MKNEDGTTVVVLL